ncbi:MAG: aminoacyl-tRNA hydrolase [Frankiales bacterium]|nr:aminoacyl-tRNA hydrolase [Frankiales bacterium]
MSTDTAPWLVVGLGNPGTEYAGTRHNIGYLVVEELAARVRGSFATHKRARAKVAEERLAGHRAVLAKPMTYMNESGGPVKGLADFYKVPLEHLVVVHDELDLPFAALRLKMGGGDNGHNGLRSLRRSLGTGDYHRVRVGIGRPPGRQDPADFVLKPWSGTERKELDLLVSEAADAVELLVSEGLERAQNRYNS